MNSMLKYDQCSYIDSLLKYKMSKLIPCLSTGCRQQCSKEAKYEKHTQKNR